ncbi:TGS domain-containing protein [Solirubrobacter ginsenosidimutans]|uniref:TGS domain-containing protein n=1 Tax=Solirubrobacter ginsenosidimutans TaxID=490573 RepID=A0A9X3S6Q1_9ACTN|nr:TGS domain-containing protein [Solirubrobacter ginsenosidimutans]MDA0165331.1 TGS domain-containing protein [Solirubrobacter ginsenosidimutans]
MTIEPRELLVRYLPHDRSWAEWIAWQLEDTGYPTRLQVIRPDTLEIDSQSGAAGPLITVSPSRPFTDLTEPSTRRVAIRVRDVEIEWADSHVVDLVGLDETEARRSVLAVLGDLGAVARETHDASGDQRARFRRLFRRRTKPSTRPPLPRSSDEWRTAVTRRHEVFTRGGRFPDRLGTWNVPEGATLLDLAFYIHTAIGSQATGALVNGREVDFLGHVLEPGDIVEIIRADTIQRTEADVENVKTPRGHRKLREALRAFPVIRGRLRLLEHLAGYGLRPSRDDLDPAVEQIAGRFGGTHEDSTATRMYTRIADGRSTPGEVASAVIDALGRLLRVVTVLPDGRTVTGSAGGLLQVWAQDGTPADALDPHIGSVCGISALGSARVGSADTDGGLWIWDLTTGDSHVAFSLPVPCAAMAAWPSPPRVGVAGIDGSIRIEAIDQEVGEWPELRCPAYIEALVAARDGPRLFAGCRDGSIHGWDVNTGQEFLNHAPHADRVLALAVTTDGQTVCSGAADGSTAVLETSDARPRAGPRHPAAVHALAVAADGRFVSGCADGVIRVWRSGGEPIGLPRTHGGAVRDIALLDDEQIVSVSEDGELHIQSLLPAPAGVPATPWRLTIDRDGGEVRVGSSEEIRLVLAPASRPDQFKRHVLVLPITALDLTVFVEAPGFRLETPSPITIPVVDGTPQQTSIAVSMTAIASGDHTITAVAYQGAQAARLEPAEAQFEIHVRRPEALPQLPELVHADAIPGPPSDVMVFVTVEESVTSQRLAFYLTCSRLGYDAERLELPPITVDDARGICQQLAELSAFDGSPASTRAATQAFGGMLADTLMPRGPLREAYEQLRDAPATWFVLSDERAVMPWELVCPYYLSQESADVVFEPCLAEDFDVAHWITGQGLRLDSEAPMARVAIADYGAPPAHLRPWREALGEDPEQPSGVDLLASDNPYFGLHVIRFAREDIRDGITQATEDSPLRQPLVQEHRLELTRRRPLVTLSFIGETPADGGATQIERAWAAPLLRSGATAVVGPRWRVPASVDERFVKTLYDGLREGASLADAVRSAREAVRAHSSHRQDWLAYAVFGHPQCAIYLVRPAGGFALFEAIDEPEHGAFLAGHVYRFRVSYRAEAPAWYDGRLHTRDWRPSTDDVSVAVIPMAGGDRVTHSLNRIEGCDDHQAVMTLRMPTAESQLSLMLRFESAGEELRSLWVDLDIQELQP